VLPARQGCTGPRFGWRRPLRLGEDLPGHRGGGGTFDDELDAEDFARTLGREMPDLEEVKVIAEDAGQSCT
jgi:hypothetical protein